MGTRVEELEEQVLADASPETLRELNSIKGQLLGLRRAITPQREAVNKLIRDESELVSDTVRTYLRDTYDHVVQTTEAVESARELVNGLINTYLSVISNRMNEVMKTLTIVASIFVPLTFGAGIYGMNFENMPELQNQWAYPVVLILMTLTAGGMVLYFWRKGWIGRRR
jgi:magnesium transporter